MQAMANCVHVHIYVFITYVCIAYDIQQIQTTSKLDILASFHGRRSIQCMCVFICIQSSKNYKN